MKKLILFFVILLLTGCNVATTSSTTQHSGSNSEIILKVVEEEIQIEAFQNKGLNDYLMQRFGINGYFLRPNQQTLYEKVGKYSAEVFVSQENTLYKFSVDYSDTKGPTIKKIDTIYLCHGVPLSEHKYSITYLMDMAIDMYDESGNLGFYSPEDEESYFSTDKEGLFNIPWKVTDGKNWTDINLPVLVGNVCERK